MKKLFNFSSFFTLIMLLTLSSCEVNDVTKITLDENSKKLILGQIDSLFADTKYDGNIVPMVIWKSSNTKIVTVKNGQIEGLKKGSAIITATAGDETTTCTITVEDEITPTLTKGELWYWGDAYNRSISNNYTVLLASSGINMENLTGNGEFMYLEFNTPLTVVDSIPSGTYTIDTTLIAKTLVSGYVDNSNNPWGTWYFGSTFNNIVGGTAIVKVANKIYDIQYEFLDYYGNIIYGSFKGSLPYFNLTAQQSIPKQKIIKQKKQIRLTKKLFVQIKK